MSSEENLLPLIIEPEQLAEHLDDPQLLIVDVPLRSESHEEATCPAPCSSISAA